MLGAAFFLSGCSSESKKEKFLESAERYFEADRYAEAELEYRNLLRLDPHHPQAVSRLGTIWLDQGLPLRALPYLAKASELLPEDLEVQMSLVQGLRELGRIEEARLGARGVLEKSPGDDEALLALAQTARDEGERKEVEALLQENSAGSLLVSATLAFQRDDQDLAKANISRILAEDPGSMPARLLLVDLLASQEKFAEATEQLRLATEYAPVRSKVRLQYAAATARLGKEKEADEILRKLTTDVPDYLPAWLLRARFAFQAKDYARCFQFLDKLFAEDPRHYDGLLLKSEVLIAQRKGAEALEVLKQFETAYPGGVIAPFGMARAALLDGNTERALESLETAVSRDPDHAGSNLMLARLLGANGEIERAEKVLESYLAAHPGHARATSLLADVQQAAGRSEQARETMTEQAEAMPEDVNAQVRMGVLLINQGKLNEARKALEKAQALAPANLRITQQLVELDLAQQNTESAYARARSAVQRSPESALSHALLGRVHAGAGKGAEAEVSLKKALSLDPNYFLARSILISIYASSGRMEDVMSELEYILASPHAAPRALLLAATIYQEQGQDAKAAAVYERMLEKEPNSPMAQNNLAYLYAEKLGKLPEAFVLATKARSMQPDNPVVAETLGWIHFRRGEYQEALGLLEKAAAALPESAEVLYHLGMTHAMMGNDAAARPILEKAVAAESEFAGKDLARRQLAEISEGGAASVESLLAILQERPKNVAARMRLARAYEARGEVALAVAAYEAALKENPDLLEAAKRLARLYGDQLEKLPEALEYARTARRLASDDAEIVSYLGQLHYRNGEYRPAYTLLRGSAETAPALLDLARASYALGKIPEALESMKRVGQEAPGSAEASFATEFLEIQNLRADHVSLLKSKERVKAVLQKDPGHGPALMASGAISLAEGDEESAIATYREALARYPACTPAKLALATVYSSDPERLAEAHKLAMSARSALPEDAAVAQVLAVVAYHRKEYGYAVQLLRQVQSKAALDSEGRAYLGLAHWRAGQQVEATPLLREAAKGQLGARIRAEVTEVLAAGAVAP